MELLGGADGHDHSQVQQHSQGGDDHQSHRNEHLLSDGLGSHGRTGFCGAVSGVHVFPVPSALWRSSWLISFSWKLLRLECVSFVRRL